MEITEVKVFPVRDKKLRAFASIVFDGVFMVNDIKVIQGKDGYFISMPSRRRKNGRFKDIAHPLNQPTRQLLEETIISEYLRVAEGEAADEPAADGGERAPGPAADSGQRAEGPAADRRERAGAPRADTAPAAPAAPEAPAAQPSQKPRGKVPSEAAAAAAEAPATPEKPAPAGERPPEAPETEETEDKSLDEVAEAHLSDSYWTT